MHVDAAEVLLTAVETNIANHACADSKLVARTNDRKNEAKTANESSLTMSTPSHVDMLADRDTWIADSGATSHGTPHGAGFQDCRMLLNHWTLTPWR